MVFWFLRNRSLLPLVAAEIANLGFCPQSLRAVLDDCEGPDVAGRHFRTCEQPRRFNPDPHLFLRQRTCCRAHAEATEAALQHMAPSNPNCPGQGGFQSSAAAEHRAP